MYLFVPHVFLDIGIGSSHDASSPHEYEVSITHVWPKYQPQPRSFKLVNIFVDGLLCSRSSPRVRQKAIMCFNGHGNLGRDKLQDLKVHPRLWEFMSILLHDFHVIVWSCMEVFALYNAFWCLSSKYVTHILAFCVGQIKVHRYEWSHS